ncbi:type II restriction endonuclease [Candidatus Magnetoovum chiemensis]|nr:type II restriction endonuclease [Candidatus Magnetoovum chiemensis]
MKERTFGWVQDPGKVEHLRLVVEIFAPNSKTHEYIKNKVIPTLILEKDGLSRLITELNKKPLSLNYRDLVGTAFKPRASARCNAIIQAAVKGQKRPFISDWPADNFLRWAVSLGFVKWNEKTDEFSITELGLSLSQTEIASNEEYKIYEEALLSYPPVSRIINLIAQAGENNDVLTKFEIGKSLGFIGEEGFTSISQNLFVKEISSALKEEKIKIRSNWEGDSDKYARMICSWLTQLKFPWIERVRKKINIDFAGKKYSYTLQAYTITRKGYEIRKMISGSSKFRKVPKIVYFEMLATKGKDRKYLRTRRAYIIEFLLKQSLSLEEIQEELNIKGFSENLATIKDDLKGLNNIGLSIKNETKDKYYCADEIVGLNIPNLEVEKVQKSNILDVIEKCREKINNIPHEYLALIPMSFDENESTMFEIKTIELLTEHCKFDGLHCGGASKPDGLIYSEDYGVIIDTKSYKDGFNIQTPERDKMKRYIEENQNRNPQHNKTRWWDEFPHNISNFLFLFVSGKFGGNFKEQLRILSEQTNNTLGGALSSYVLLNIAEQIAINKIDHCDFKTRISCLDEVAFD